MPISIVASESAFSTRGRMLNNFRSSLTPRMVEALFCTQDWIRRSEPTNGAEITEEVDKLDKCMSGLNITCSFYKNVTILCFNNASFLLILFTTLSRLNINGGGV